MMCNFSGIYKIQSLIHLDKFYIGSSCNLATRYSVHTSLLRDKKHFNEKLQAHYNKYGKDGFSFQILIFCKREELEETEQNFINNLNPWFNIAKRVLRGPNKYSEETKEKMRIKAIGRIATQETRDKISESLIGNQRAAGHAISEEGLQKIKDTRAEQVFSDESMKKRSESLKRAWVKRKIDDAILGREPWNKGRKGVYSEETLNKMREAAQKRKNNAK